MTWDEEADGPEPTQEQSDRLEIFLNCGSPDFAAGPITVTAAALGTDDEWAWSAIEYLKTITPPRDQWSDCGAAVVSIAAVSCLLGYVERLQIAAGIIPAPPETSAGGARA